MKLKSVARGETLTTQLLMAGRELKGRVYDDAAKDPGPLKGYFRQAASDARKGNLDFYATGPNWEIASNKGFTPVLVNGRPLNPDDWK